MCINELWLDPDKTSFQMNRNIVSHEHSNLLAIQGCAQTQTQTDTDTRRPSASSPSLIQIVPAPTRRVHLTHK